MNVEILNLPPVEINEFGVETVMYPEAFTISEPTEMQRYRLIEASGVLDFWNDPEEDGYTQADGDPI